MPQLTQQRCFNHAGREAAARCPECQQFFCRECITEHDDRVICATCLAKLAKPKLRQRGWYQLLVRFAAGTAGFVCAWLFFHWMGRLLLRIPSKYHEGTVWQMPWGGS